MSKRSYRRLALVAGAALAVGSMAPALAANVNAGGSGSASVDLSGVAGSLPSITSLVPTGLIGTVTGTALSTVQGAPTMVVSDVSGLMSGVLGVTGGLTGGNSIASVNVAGTDSVGASVLGTGVAVTGATGTAAGLSGGVAGLPTAVLGTALGTAGPVVGTAFGVVNTATGLVQSVPGTALGTASGLLGNGLGILGGASASGNVNVLAGLMGSL